MKQPWHFFTFSWFMPITMGIVLLVYGCSPSNKVARLHKHAKKQLATWQHPLKQWGYLGKIKADSINIFSSDKRVEFVFSRALSYIPLREDSYTQFYQSLQSQLGKPFKDYSISIKTGNRPFHEFIPNCYRKEVPVDEKRVYKYKSGKVQVVRRLGEKGYAGGLSSNSIALWHSHGYYYEPELDRWEWQRARLFGTVEDLSPMAYVLPYLVPMLENAGANVFLPRERDVQVNEVIVDNDKSTGQSEFILSANLNEGLVKPGFLLTDTLYTGVNPFTFGTSVAFEASKNIGGKITCIPEIPARGEYAVYIAYQQNPENCSAVTYTVNHAGGTTNFVVNQKMGGGTWIYLGTFQFSEGKSSTTASVTIKVAEGQSGWVSADAVKFGGGMGNVARKPANEIVPNVKSSESISASPVVSKKALSGDFTWKLSGKPRFTEGARYFLQYSGMPDSLVYSLNKNMNDYNDDYQCRGAWVNYLMGTAGALKNKGLGIPVDLSLAFHTDAGLTPNDSVIGTLVIYNTALDNGIFPSGQSKMVNRDFADIVQSQIVDDIRAQFNPNWTRRALWDRKYSEAVKPNVPSLLLELLSHQNMAEVKFGLDPRFRFTVGRSIYKGILKFQAWQEGRPYVVQPLPVNHFSIVPVKEKTVLLTWKPVADPLEHTATPNSYKVYKRIADGGFDNGTLVTDTSYTVTLDEFNKIYSFKVTAINDGGESFPGEILSVGLKSEPATKVLVVNGFDRISGPQVVDSENFAGIAWWDDQGVPDKCDIGFTGQQYDFNRKSEWKDDDNPGWGACYGNMEGKIIPGNTFDFTYLHGEAIMAAGYSFVSVSDEAFCNPAFDASGYKTIDVILGEEKSTPDYKNPSQYNYSIYTPEFRRRLREVTERGSNLFISGAYVGTDLTKVRDSLAVKFVAEVLHFAPGASHAVKEGNVYVTNYASNWFKGNWNFATSYRPEIYATEAPGAIEPLGGGAVTAFRYGENSTSAGIAYRGNYNLVIVGFPFETIFDKLQRENFMLQILKFLQKNNE